MENIFIFIPVILGVMAANTMKYLFAFFDVAEPKAISHIPIYELSLGLLWAWAFVELPMIEAFIFSLITLLITAIGWIDLKSFKIPFLLIITSSLILIGSIFLDQIQATPAFLGLSIGGIIPWAIMVTTSIFTKRKGMGTGDFQDELDEVVQKYNKKIIAAGLISDYLRQPFGDVIKLIPHAEEVIKLNALCKKCKDGTKASFTRRTTNDTNTVIVGSDTYYEAVCRKHYLK